MTEVAQEFAPTDLSITSSAVQRIRVLREKEGKPGAALRLRIIAGGCSGMQYRIDLAEKQRVDDRGFDRDGVRVLVDGRSMTYLKNSTLDWYEDLLGGQFRITNPNAKTSCSCGISFTV